MSRQDANAAFALTSFLYGGNAAYLEAIYDRYEADPNAVLLQYLAMAGNAIGRGPFYQVEGDKLLIAYTPSMTEYPRGFDDREAFVTVMKRERK